MSAQDACDAWLLVLPKQNKMSAFHAQNPTQTCVWHGQQLAPHHTKNQKKEGSPDFLLF